MKGTNEYHGDEDFVEEVPIRKEWTDYKVIVIWDNDENNPDDVTDKLYLGNNCMEIEEQLDILADEMEADGEWGYVEDMEEHY